MAQVITTLLLGDDPNSVRVADMANWKASVFIIPRTFLASIRDRQDLRQPGVYFLFGEGEEKPRAYIGQSEDCFARLTTHDRLREEEQWNEAMVFTGGLHSTYVKYLESIAVSVAKKAGRYEVINKTAPAENQLSESQKVTAESFFANMRFVTTFFGYKLFDQKISPEVADVYLLEDVNNKDASARGSLMSNGEFVVYAGSKFRVAIREGLKTHGQNIIALREALMQKALLRQEGEGSYVLSEDYIFSSPSQAATTVHGRSCNGWTGWKDKEGRTLDENVRQ
jgi:hypothetical protein